MSGVPSITSVRERVRSMLARAGGRDVIVLGLDGIPRGLAAAAWQHGRSAPLQSVFPTTSTSCWLSSLTGMEVATHGVVGVVFRLPERGRKMIDALSYEGSLSLPPITNIFSDARAQGHHPVAVLGDLEDHPSSWRRALLEHAELVGGHRFYAGAPPGLEAHDIAARVGEAIATARATGPRDRPRLVWCFVDIDLHIHRHGYDEHVREVLDELQRLALGLLPSAMVAAHSDHGLTATTHDAALTAALETIVSDHGAAMGGAGRVRWIHPDGAPLAKLRRSLSRHLPASVALGGPPPWPAGSRGRDRVGPLVLEARGESFVTSPEYRFEHGSSTPAEVEVAWCEWGER